MSPTTLLRSCFVGFVISGMTVAASASGSVLPRVAVVRSAEWLPGDNVRDGAGEFAVYLRAAQLQRFHRHAGIVAVGDHNGMLRSGGERALRRVVLTGVAIVKLAPGGNVVADEHDLFLRAGLLDAEEVAGILTRCLERHGAPPAATDPENPTPRELAAIRTHLQPFQVALVTAHSRDLAQTTPR